MSNTERRKLAAIMFTDMGGMQFGWIARWSAFVRTMGLADDQLKGAHPDKANP